MTNSREFKGHSIIAFPNEYVVVDLETTGKSPKYDEIIEFAALRVCDDKVTDKFRSLVCPSRKISPYIFDLTGISNDMVFDAPTISDVLPKFLDFVGDNIVVGHNVNFDINFIYDACLQFNAAPFPNDYVDTLRIYRKLFPKNKHHRLADMVLDLNVNTSQFHRAEADCMSTFECFLRLKALALQKYSSADAFAKSFVYRKYSLDPSQIVSQTDVYDETHPLYGMNCAFTGKLEKMKRADAMQLVVNCGGICQDGLNKNTDILIVGNFDYSANIKGDKSNKLIKAEDMQLKGMAIQIIPEDAFYDMI